MQTARTHQIQAAGTVCHYMQSCGGLRNM